MVSRMRGAAAWVTGVLVVIGCSAGVMAQAAAPASVRDSAVLYVFPPGAEPAPAAGEGPAAPGAAGDDAIWQRSIATHAHLIAHPSNLYAVLTSAQSGVRDTRWFARHASPDDAVAWLQRHFKATPVPGTALIELSLDSEADRAEAGTIVNAIATRYLERDSEGAQNKIVEQIDLYMNLKTRYDQLGRVSRSELVNLSATLQLDGMGRPGFLGQKEQELQILTAERLKATAAVAAAELAYKQATQEVQAGRTPGGVELQLGNDWEIVNLRQQVRLLKDQAGAANALADRTAAVERELAQRLADKRAVLTDAYVSALKSQWDGARANVDAMIRQIDELKNQLAELGAKVAEYVTKKEEETAYRELSRRYAQQLDRLNVTRQRIMLGQVIFAAKATERP